MTHRRQLGPGTDRQEPAEVVAGARRTAVQRAAEAALPPVAPTPARTVTGRRPLAVREERTPEDQAPSAG